MTPLTTRVTKLDHVMVQEIGDESALLNLKNERYFALDDVGTRMWSLLTSAATIEQAQDVLLSEYDVEADRLQTDLHALIRELVRNDLVCLSAADVA